MESCLGVEREVSRVQDKISTVRNGQKKILDSVIQTVQQVKEELLNVGENSPLSPSQTISLIQALQTAKESTKKVATDHRDLHSSVSKVGKAIDRNFVSDYDSTSRSDIFSSPEQAAMLNQVVLQHFYRHGQLEIAETLAREANLNECLKDSKQPFQELNSILESLHRRDLRPALDWAERNRMELNARGTLTIPSGVVINNNNDDDDDNNAVATAPRTPTSSLELKLHKLQFIEILKGAAGEAGTVNYGQNRLDAIKYARAHFPRFVQGHEREVATLMGALMYIGPRFSESPYAHLLSDNLWKEIAELFVRDACALMGLSVESALAVAVNAGCTALPALLNIKQVMLQHAGVWSAKDELPIEIDLGTNSRYHSIFACPILRQQTSDSNPPLKLTCGHCISRDALNKLSSNSGHKLKCPYCPVEQNPGDARQIFL